MKQTHQSILIRLLVYICAILTGTAIITLVCYILAKGVPYISKDLFSFIYTSENASLFPALVNTLIITAVSLLFALPAGIGAAIYLAEYAKRGNKTVKIIRTTVETLSGIPSIVYGLFGFLFFVTFLGWQFSLLAGCCTLAIMILPVIMRTTEEAMLAVPDSFREASYGLGAGKVRTIFKIILPSAIPGIVNGCILSAGRIVGETAALIYTAGSVAKIPASLMGSGRTLAVHLYSLWCEGLKVEQAYATAVVLIAFAAVLNMLSGLLERIIARRNNG